MSGTYRCSNRSTRRLVLSALNIADKRSRQLRNPTRDTVAPTCTVSSNSCPHVPRPPSCRPPLAVIRSEGQSAAKVIPHSTLLIPLHPFLCNSLFSFLYFQQRVLEFEHWYVGVESVICGNLRERERERERERCQRQTKSCIGSTGCHCLSCINARGQILTLGWKTTAWSRLISLITSMLRSLSCLRHEGAEMWKCQN